MSFKTLPPSLNRIQSTMN